MTIYKLKTDFIMPFLISETRVIFNLDILSNNITNTFDIAFEIGN